MPALSAVYGLMPWHLDGGDPLLTFGEIDEYAQQATEAAAFLQLRAEMLRG